MPHASTEVIDLDSSEDEAPVTTVIDLTLESDEEAKVVTNGGSIPTPPPVIPPRSTAVDSINNAQPSRSPSVEASSHSDTSPVKRKPRKKRSLKNPDVGLRIRSPSPPREPRRFAHAKRASNASTGLYDDEEPAISIKKPSFIAKPGLKAMQRLKIGTKAPSGGSAPKLNSGSTKGRKNNDVTAPKKKTATVKKVLNATLESLVPTVTAESSRANRPVSVDEYPAFFQDDDSPELDYHAPPTPPPLTPAANVAAEPRRINPDYEPYSPTAASRGAGSTSNVDWYVNLPHSGWHSQSATAHPYLPPVPSRPATSTSTSFPSTDEQSLHHKSTNLSRKRKSRIITSDESDSSQPTAVKKRKYSLDEDENELHLSTSLDRILDAVAHRSPDVAMADVGATAVAEDEDLLESDEEIDQLIETSPEPITTPVLSPGGRRRRGHSYQTHSPPSMHAEEEISMDFGNGFDDVQMDDTIIAPTEQEDLVRQRDQRNGLPAVHMEEDWDGTIINLNEDGDESEVEGSRQYFDPAERERKKLLDEFADVLDQYPEFTRGYRRPGISPENAPWVVLAPLLRRKLELERIKLRKFENGE